MNSKQDYLQQADKSKHWASRVSVAQEYFDLIKRFDPDIKGKTLLDVGCAEGEEVSSFNKLGLKAEGLDVNAEFILIMGKYPVACRV